MSDLHVFSDGDEFVVAADEADARLVIQNHCGPDIWGDAMDLNQMPDNEQFTIACDNGTKESKTYGEWAAEKGRCYLCDSEDLS